MDDALGVRRLERVRDLGAEVEQGRDLEGALADPLAQRLALEQLHRDEVLPLVLVDRVDRADAGVVEGRGGAGLALEALERGGVPGHLGRQELERDVAAEGGVLGLVDDAHPTAAELRGDAVVRHRATDHFYWLSPEGARTESYGARSGASMNGRPQAGTASGFVSPGRRSPTCCRHIA